MTFYWWSHWFWITLLSIILLLPIVFVHTYPSHDIAPEYNNNNNSNNKNLKSVTKLYQTTTTVIWATTLPPIHKELATVVTQARTKLLNIPATVEEPTAATTVKDVKDEVVENVDRSDSGVLEFKRSTDENQFNKTGIERKAKIAQPPARQSSDSETSNNSPVIEPLSGQATASDVKSLQTTTRQEKELKDLNINSNYSNFSSITASKNEKMESSEVQNATAEKLATSSSSLSLSSSLTPSQPQIENNAHSTIEWLNSRADEEDFSSSSSIGHKVPFTLENVNKEDEIVRAENEHRSRKSKVLSAEYNHINRFINFSTDSKNLLTRSASTAPNEYDADEGNISSEALAIKRTYFLDASAISAICFIVFGVCCTVGTLGIVLYRRRFLNKPQALSEPDSSVYIDDSTMRDNSDEMYSLDNDSFLNSLEAMTIQNYWTDTVKHTKL